MTIRVLLCDDQALVRGGFRMILEARPDLQVVGEAEDGAQAVRLARQTQPDAILMDVRMPLTSAWGCRVSDRMVKGYSVVCASKAVPGIGGHNLPGRGHAGPLPWRASRLPARAWLAAVAL